MLNPGNRALAQRAVTTAITGEAQTAFTDLGGIQAATIEAQFQYGSGGTTAKVWVQVSLDLGQTWIDVACFAFTTASATKVINLSGMTPVTTAITPSDGAMADNTYQDGIMGSSWRAKVTTTGTYANTNVVVRLEGR
ncbi:hypothetical protein [Bradyrhizobium sp. 6(2017)]|uniref:hypothetical protein n=1 Tax=Bradyrhizobium sp. 6(2017) TaxID=1197460 RepID=UPI0013E204CC|nr:hypothetical protein [Bradyrhizobium sp. 6(2017)]QIG92883.1 hypothetical protein G6P99_10435 [Bradyrhizobium sp. 6(2017)]